MLKFSQFTKIHRVVSSAEKKNSSSSSSGWKLVDQFRPAPCIETASSWSFQAGHSRILQQGRVILSTVQFHNISEQLAHKHKKAYYPMEYKVDDKIQAGFSEEKSILNWIEPFINCCILFLPSVLQNCAWKYCLFGLFSIHGLVLANKIPG